MPKTLIILTHSLLLINLCISPEPEPQLPKIENEKNCRERNRLIASNNGDLYSVVDATLGERLILQCHYCNENDDSAPKVWYKQNLTTKSYDELQLDMSTNVTANRVHVNAEHSLVIRNASRNDTGIYRCTGSHQQEEENRYGYLVDCVFTTNSSFETGNLSDWRKYHEENFVPVNGLFAKSRGSEFAAAREVLHLQMDVVTEWEPWGICEVCGRPKGEGRRRKKGFCRVKVTRLGTNASVDYSRYGEAHRFLANAYAVSCRSLALNEAFPGISNLTRVIPHFVQEEPCEGTCNPDAEGFGRGWKTGKSLDFKYKKTFVLAQNAHLTIVCPESTLENVVVWRKNGKVLPAGESIPPENPEDEPHVTVDTFNTLYLTTVTHEEEGNYTCQVDKIRMQQVRVYIVSKSRLLTQAFIRHMMYLAFVLSLTVSCYCAGLVVTWTRRRTFKIYEDFKTAKNDEDEYDSLI